MAKPLPGRRSSILEHSTRSFFERIDYSDRLLASSTGDVGLMKVNRNTWRSLYDVKGLNGDISYNGHAGAEILHYYLTRYAIQKKRMRKKTVISRARRTQPITLVLGDSRATAACAKLPRGKKWTKLSGTSFKR